ncbi:hypothetical protein GQ44DRAFT_704594 [Phaeosphaeriaceae sp. PMI808]|nr:hypothetical protein GQ44DRAFT_704594 [Phaeosphaeriaceae sp. PMI808]
MRVMRPVSCLRYGQKYRMRYLSMLLLAFHQHYKHFQSTNYTKDFTTVPTIPKTIKMNSQPAGNKDYGDKALESAEKKFGGSMGQNTEKNRGINEKITDSARGAFEKATGKHVPEKVSN